MVRSERLMRTSTHKKRCWGEMSVHISNLDEELRERMKKPTTVIGGIAKSLRDVNEKLQEIENRLKSLEDRVKALEERK